MSKKMIEMEEEFFEHLLHCMANQKFIGEAPPNGDALEMGQESYEELQEGNQAIIDKAWNKGMTILNGKVVA